MSEAEDRNLLWRRELERYNDTARLIDELIPRLVASEFWEREFMTRLSNAKTQRGTHIDSMPKQAQPAKARNPMAKR